MRLQRGEIISDIALYALGIAWWFLALIIYYLS